MIIGRWEVMECKREGFYLLAPTSYWKATPEVIEEKTGGCGPGWLGDIFVPDTMLGESVFLACQIHDWMYGEGITKEDKRIADRIFLWNMTVLIQDTPQTGETEGDAADLIRLRRAMTYYEAVSYGGNDAFENGETVKGGTTT